MTNPFSRGLITPVMILIEHFNEKMLCLNAEIQVNERHSAIYSHKYTRKIQGYKVVGGTSAFYSCYMNAVDSLSWYFYSLNIAQQPI